MLCCTQGHTGIIGESNELYLLSSVEGNCSLSMVMEKLPNPNGAYKAYSMAVGVVTVDDRSFHFYRGTMYGENIIKITARSSCKDGHWLLYLTGIPHNNTIMFNGGITRECGFLDRYLLTLKIKVTLI